ncbi:TrfB-related DNA-binding protein [Pseudomonas sp.]|uniref:TrfB-related DNA-binding protein n=1 Tax=Pseudomonas sp. TaxID=306 RepID=UPI003FD79784
MAMTSEQYDALVKLMGGSPESRANRAARRVLLDGITQANAMRETGVTRATVNHAVKRYADANKLMRSVYIGPEK